MGRKNAPGKKKDKKERMASLEKATATFGDKSVRGKSRKIKK